MEIYFRIIQESEHTCKFGTIKIYTFKYHVFAPMGRFQLELIYLYFPQSSHLIYMYVSVL